jgi:hypothetical protein
MPNAINTLERPTSRPQPANMADALAAHRARMDAMLAAELEQPWTNPGTTPEEIRFYARKREQWERENGGAGAPTIAPTFGLKHVSNSLPPPPRAERERKPRVKRGYRHHRRNEWYRPGQHQTPLDRNQVAKIMFLAESIERKTKEKGRFNGCVTKPGLEILRALLKHFYNYQNGGQCDPSYDAIQRVTGFCRQTIADALKALEACRIITVARRLVRVMIKSRCPVTGEVRECPATQQTSNAYMFNVVKEAKPTPPEGWSWPDDCRNPSDSLSIKAESTRQRESNPIYTKKCENRPTTDRCTVQYERNAAKGAA